MQSMKYAQMAANTQVGLEATVDRSIRLAGHPQARPETPAVSAKKIAPPSEVSNGRHCPKRYLSTSIFSLSQTMPRGEALSWRRRRPTVVCHGDGGCGSAKAQRVTSGLIARAGLDVLASQ